jgi:hypothetical protein
LVVDQRRRTKDLISQIPLLAQLHLLFFLFHPPPILSFEQALVNLFLPRQVQ